MCSLRVPDPQEPATAISLVKSGLSVGLLHKATFPRDKICGDALSVDVVNPIENSIPFPTRKFQ